MEDLDDETKGKKNKRKEYKAFPSLSEMFLEATTNLSSGCLSTTKIKDYIFNQHNIDITQHIEDLDILKTRNSELKIHGRLPERRQVKSPKVPKRSRKPLVQFKKRQEVHKSNPKRSCTTASSNYSTEGSQKRSKAQTALPKVKSPKVPKRSTKPLAQFKKRQEVHKSNPKRSCTTASSNYSTEGSQRRDKTQTGHPIVIVNVPLVRNTVLNDTRVKTKGNSNALKAVNTECNKEKIALTDEEKGLQLHPKSKAKKHPLSRSTVDEKSKNEIENDDLQSESTISKAGSAVKNFIGDLGTKCASSLNYLSIPFTNSPSSRSSKNPTNKMKKKTNDQPNDTCSREKPSYSTRSSNMQTINSLPDESGDACITSKVKMHGETKKQKSKASKTKIRKKITEKGTATDIPKKEKRVSSGSTSVIKPSKRMKNLVEIDICSVEKDNTFNSSVCTSDDVITGDNEMTKATELYDDSIKNRSIITRRVTNSSAQIYDEKLNEIPSTHNKERNKKSRAKKVRKKK